jgi:predicted transcriptional regulator of viral defense system
MSKDTIETAQRIFAQHGSILRNSQAKKLGINEFTLSEMVRSGVLTQDARGIYRLSTAPQLSNPDIALVAMRVPKGVICLISALHYYNLTTQIPFRVYIALPREIKAPGLEYPPMDVTYLSETAYQSGIDAYSIDGIPVKMYSREKTIADCFKFRRKIGQDVAIEALKDYLKGGHSDLDQVLHYSKIDRVEKVIRPYIETLIA